VYVNLLRSPGIDSQPGGPVQQPYLTYRHTRLYRLAEAIPWYRFLGSLNVYKFGLRPGASAKENATPVKQEKITAKISFSACQCVSAGSSWMAEGGGFVTV
jgi:hypothetical protein